jgi:uncharacterized protein YyaL (SSP411 family)
LFIEDHLIVDRWLMVRYRDGETANKGFLDDYAYTTQMDMKEVVVITNDFDDRFVKRNQHEFLPEVLSGG